MLVACNNNEQEQNNAQPAFFVGKVIEIYDSACLIEVTDDGNTIYLYQVGICYSMFFPVLSVLSTPSTCFIWGG